MARSYHCAVITGASSGLGAEFARQLGARCGAMVLVARREDRLRALAEKLRAAHPGLRVLPVALDLTADGGCEAVRQACAEAGVTPDLLINNAGLGDYGEFASSDPAKVERMLRLNIEALTLMTLAVLPGMLRMRGGAILNVSSMAGELPIPDFAVYAASKAYVSSFSEALRLELRGRHIHVTALCPGPVHTEFGAVAMRDQKRRRSRLRDLFYTTPEQVVAEALAGMERNQPRVFPGLKILAGAMLLGVLPLAVVRVAMSTRPRRHGGGATREAWSP